MAEPHETANRHRLVLYSRSHKPSFHLDSSTRISHVQLQMVINLTHYATAERYRNYRVAELLWLRPCLQKASLLALL